MLADGSSLIDKLDLRSAVRNEASWQPDLVPVPLVNRYIEDACETMAEFVGEIGRGGLAPSPADVLAASKWRYGRRPVAFLPIVERVLYRGVVSLLADDLPPVHRDSDTYSQFLRGPLGTPAKYVIITDLANFYSSIPTARLCDELLDRTGQWQPVEWLREFWLSVSGGNSGIPQVSEPSHRVAEAYADELHCRLLRRGISVWRYADDFRLAAASLGSAFEALETFDEETRALGLYVNERKTYRVSRGRYEENLYENEARLGAIVDEVRDELTNIDVYHFDLVTPDQAEVLREASLRMLRVWQEQQSVNGSPPPRGAAVSNEMEVAKLVRLALLALAAVGEPAGISYCDPILRWEPQLTPQVIKYLEALAEHHTKAIVIPTVQAIIANVPLTKWQQLWLASLLAHRQTAPGLGHNDVVAWLESCTQDSSEMLRSQAVWALACNWSLDKDVWERVSRQATRLGTPYLAAALNNVKDIAPNVAEKLASGSKLEKWVHKWAVQHLPPPF